MTSWDTQLGPSNHPTFVRLLAERGAKLVLGARRSDRLKALADRITASGGEAANIPADVKRRGAIFRKNEIDHE